LHFKFISGTGTPILFESGAGDGASVWDSIIRPIAELTNTTLISYDRAGFGTSTIDTLAADTCENWILDGLMDLEFGLEALGFDKDIILVSHSYGGYISSLYASKYPDKVKSLVLIDVSHNFHLESAEKEAKKHKKEVNKLRNSNPGFYYLATNYPKTAKYMSNISISENIPIIDIVHGVSFMKSKRESKRWQTCHRDFVTNHSRTKAIKAENCGHYIWYDNPCLVIELISRNYFELTEKID
jgi:pimeloyl-ACP methyl ester carboxylesterase